MNRFVRTVVVVAVCSLLGGVSSCGVGTSVAAPASELSRSFGLAVGLLLGWAAGAVVSVGSAAVWLRTDLALAAGRLSWMYLVLALLAGTGLGLAANMPGGSGGWSLMWFTIFTGAWTSAALAGGIAVRARLRKRVPAGEEPT